ncbi:MAG: nucleotidyltransferase domain-containing protein [Chloroflexota bacterium]
MSTSPNVPALPRYDPNGATDGVTDGEARSAAWLPTIIDRLVAQFAPLQIILFGSYARGTAHRGSDLDMLVVLPDEPGGLRHREVTVAMLRALSDLPVAKDVVVTTPEEIASRGHLAGMVLREALREGKLLYGRASS